jgi:hypothetical protein
METAQVWTVIGFLTVFAGGLLALLGTSVFSLLNGLRENTKELADVKIAVGSLDTRVASLEHKVEAHGPRFDAIDRRLDAHDGRFDAIDRRLDAHDGRFDAIDRRLDAHDGRFDAIDGRFDVMDRRFDVLEEQGRTLGQAIYDLSAQFAEHLRRHAS